MSTKINANAPVFIPNEQLIQQQEEEAIYDEQDRVSRLEIEGDERGFKEIGDDEEMWQDYDKLEGEDNQMWKDFDEFMGEPAETAPPPPNEPMISERNIEEEERLREQVMSQMMPSSTSQPSVPQPQPSSGYLNINAQEFVPFDAWATGPTQPQQPLPMTDIQNNPQRMQENENASNEIKEEQEAVPEEVIDEIEQEQDRSIDQEQDQIDDAYEETSEVAAQMNQFEQESEQQPSPKFDMSRLGPKLPAEKKITIKTPEPQPEHTHEQAPAPATQTQAQRQVQQPQPQIQAQPTRPEEQHHREPEQASSQRESDEKSAGMTKTVPRLAVPPGYQQYAKIMDVDEKNGMIIVSFYGLEYQEFMWLFSELSEDDMEQGEQRWDKEGSLIIHSTPETIAATVDYVKKVINKSNERQDRTEAHASVGHRVGRPVGRGDVGGRGHPGRGGPIGGRRGKY